MPPHLRLYTLGPFQALLDDQSLRSFATDKERALLVFLALAPKDRPIRRESLVKMFWDGFTIDTARHSLRNALYNLRKALAPLDLLHTTRQTVHLDVAHPEFWCDALLLEQAAAGQAASLQQVQEALALVQGELLRGLELPDCPAFAVWLAGRRRRLAAQVKLLKQRRDEQLSAAPAAPQGFLPRALTPFFGREQELALLTGKMADPACGLLTITGEGGIGKTRLALALAEQVGSAFPGGVWFVPLANLSPGDEGATALRQSLPIAERLATAIAARLAIQLRPAVSPFDQVVQRLAGQRLLLLLDNFEHLLGAEPLLIDLLQAAPNLCLLVTSRRRLNLQAEYAFRLGGLPAPPPALSLETVQRYDSVQLFVERADRRRGGFVLDENNQEAVAWICRLVEGMPLGLELAAALTDQHRCNEIANAIAATVDTLAASMADLAPRHRSLRAVFEYSWQLLAPPEQAALARCAVFRGGFTPEAAAAVAGASPEVLASLADKSLLGPVAATRYDMHDLLRQLAADKLLDEPGAQERTARLHCAYYAQFLHAKEEALSDEPALMQEAAREIDNLTAAWQTAVRWLDLVALRQMARGITQLWYSQALFQQADVRFTEAVSVLRTALHDAADMAEVQAVLGRLLYLKSMFSAQLDKLPLGIAQAQEALQLGQLLGDDLLEANSNMSLAAMYWRLGDMEASEDATRRYLELAIQLDNIRLRIAALGGLSAIMLKRGQVDAARALDEQTLALALAAGRRRLTGILMNNLGTAYHTLGDFRKATEMLEQGLQIRREIQDRVGVGTALLYSGRLRLSLGDMEGARRRLEEARALFDALGSVESRALALAYGALAYLGLHAYDTASNNARQALDLAAQVSTRNTLALAHLVLARLLQAQGQLEPALVSCVEALALTEPLPDTALILAAQTAQADILAAQGDWSAAHAMVQQILPLPEQISFLPLYGNIDAYLVAGQVLASADPAQARTLLVHVHQGLLAAADTIDDPATRHAFLYEVPSHRQILALMAALKAE